MLHTEGGFLLTQSLVQSGYSIQDRPSKSSLLFVDSVWFRNSKRYPRLKKYHEYGT